MQSYHTVLCLAVSPSDCWPNAARMTDPMFDLGFLGNNGGSSSSAPLGMQSSLDQFELATAGLDNVGGTGASVFAPLTGSTHGSLLAQQTSSSGFAGFTNASQATVKAEPPLTYPGLPRTSSLADYSKHFSAEYSSSVPLTSQSQHPASQSDTTTTSAHTLVALSQGTASLASHSNTDTTDSKASSQAGTVASCSSAVPAAGTEAPVIDIIINNVVCSFSTRCHLNLKRVAREGLHVIFKQENGVRHTHVVDLIFSLIYVVID